MPGFADTSQELWQMECCGKYVTHAEATNNFEDIIGGEGNHRLKVKKCPNPYCPTNTGWRGFDRGGNYPPYDTTGF